MPTPFSHLSAARTLLEDRAIAAPVRAELEKEIGAFLLGSIAADGYYLANAPLRREDTHFFSYERPLEDQPWRLMLTRHPRMASAVGAARAFAAGYVAHLAMDEVWWLRMMRPHFGEREWADRSYRFLMLNIILTVMDERDEAAARREVSALQSAEPAAWCPFLPDQALIAWRDLIAAQIAPDGVSQTLPILAPRVGKTELELRRMLDDAPLLEADLWAHVPRELLGTVEAAMLAHARESLCAYWMAVSPGS
jgi:hypothetical protein